MKKISLLLICLCSLLQASAQYNANQNKVWAFGNHAGINFNSGSPVPFASSINTIEGTASICDAMGQLLFYTDGRTVYNRLGNTMPGGLAIVPFSPASTTQAAVIVPFIGDTNKYYVFSLEDLTGPGRLAYSVIDMTLDGGLGDVSPGSAGIIFDSGMGEKMICVRNDDCNIWLLTHKSASSQFCAYPITTSGINTTPVVSSAGPSGASFYTSGVIKCSHDRQKIVTVSTSISTAHYQIELYDFNPATGIVSNFQLLNTSSIGWYGAEFSPDNTKLYTSYDGVSQWDISLPTTGAIIASRYTLPSPLYIYSDLRLGPNGKIYFNRSYGGHYLDCINSPNSSGAGCGYAAYAVDVSPGITTYGFPNLTLSGLPPVSLSGSLSICQGATTTLTASTSGGSWNSSDPGVAVVNPYGMVNGLATSVAPGTAIIRFTAATGCVGSAVLTVNPSPAPIAGSTTIAVGSSITLTNAATGGIWSSSDTTKGIVNSAGIVTGIGWGTATIYYTLPTGCKASVVITITKKTSVTTMSTNAAKPSLYPNPASSEIAVKNEQPAFTSFTIYNAVGQLVATYTIIDTETKVNVKAYPPGEYQVVFKSDGMKEVLRFIKW